MLEHYATVGEDLGYYQIRRSLSQVPKEVERLDSQFCNGKIELVLIYWERLALDFENGGLLFTVGSFTLKIVDTSIANANHNIQGVLLVRGWDRKATLEYGRRVSGKDTVEFQLKTQRRIDSVKKDMTLITVLIRFQ